jgi:hypothetical protein
MRASAAQRISLWACGLAALLLGACATPAHAELDYEFGKLLMEQDNPSFPTEDLIQRLCARLSENPATKPEGQLIMATLKKQHSEKATTEKRKALLDEVEKLYSEILAGDKKFRHYAVAEAEKKNLSNVLIMARRKAADELRATDPQKAKQMCAEAAAEMAQIAAKHKEIVEKAKPLFDEAYKKYTTWVEKNDPMAEGRPIPPDVLAPLEKTFDAWIIADKSYVLAKVQQLECYDDSDPAKKSLAEELAKHCETQANHDSLQSFQVITAWYNVNLGRIHSTVGNAEKASEAWKTVLDTEMTNLGDDLKKQMLRMHRVILVDLIKMKMKAAKYTDVEGIVVDAMINPNLKPIFDEPSGTELLIDYAKALTLQQDAAAGEYEKAVKKLQEFIDKDQGKGSGMTMRASQFSRAIAEILGDARRKNIRPRLSPDEWYQAAVGFFLMGQYEYRKFEELEKEKAKDKAKEQFEKAYAEYSSAIDYYRRAILAARNEQTSLATRIDIEPKAWFEMGLSYTKMKHFYEAIVVFQAMRSTFLPENRKKWMPDQSKSENKKYYTKALNQALDELDKGLLVKSGSNILYALNQNASAHGHPQDFWNRKLKGEILSESAAGSAPIDVSDSKVKDLNYLRAKTEMDEAKGLSEAARNNPDPKASEENYTQALNKWISAGNKFAGIPPANEQAYEPAMYQAASAFTLAQTVLATGKLPSKKYADAKALAEELAKKALDCFDKYIQFVSTHPATEEEDKALRNNLEGAVLLARITLYAGAMDWANVVKSSDEYIRWEQKQEKLPRSSLDVAWLNKFRALTELAAPRCFPGTDKIDPNTLVPYCDPYLKDAEEAMNVLLKIKPNDKKLHLYMLTTLSQRNNIAAFQAEKFIKEKKMEPGAEDKYEEKVADLQERRISMAEAENSEPPLEDYARLVYLFDRTGKFENAVKTAKKMLDKFDPNNENVRIPDEPKVWQSLLARVNGDLESRTPALVFYKDLYKDTRCKKDHLILIDYLYDTREGRAAETPEKRPEFDKYNLDMDKALKQIETIYKNYPDCQTLPNPATKKPLPQATKLLNEWLDSWAEKYPQMQALKTGPNGEPPSILNFIEDEVDFRRKIEAGRDRLSSLALEVAEGLHAKGKEDDAKAYREMANEQIKILMKLRGDTPQMQIKAAEIDISIGNYEPALDLLYKVKHTVDKDKEFGLWFDSSRKISEVFARQKKWRDAAEFPQGIAIIAGLKSRLVKERWSQMKEFLKDCYANGVPCPLDVAKQMKDTPVPDVKEPEPPKPDEPKKEEPKAEEPKKEDVKKDEPKQDEAKKADVPKEEPKKDEKKEEPKADAPKADAP